MCPEANPCCAMHRHLSKFARYVNFEASLQPRTLSSLRGRHHRGALARRSFDANVSDHLDAKGEVVSPESGAIRPPSRSRSRRRPLSAATSRPFPRRRAGR